MKRLLRIFELSKNEQRIVLIAMLILIVIASLGYERRVHHSPVQLHYSTSVSPTVTEDER